MTEQEFQRWHEASIRNYAADHVKTGRWSEEESLERAREQFEKLLPKGLATEGQHLYSIGETTRGETIGMIWVGIQDHGEGRQAFIYDFLIHEPFRRQGYGTQALRALEPTVAALGADTIGLHVFGHNQAAWALYEKAGYVTTNVYMQKVLGAPLRQNHPSV
jgi:RimJ/RimL family protein N-acetyltransferase